MKIIKIDKATAERWLQSEVQELKDLALQTYPELGKKELPKTWGEIERISGWWVATNSVVHRFKASIGDHNKNIFATKKQAEASIALAMLSQLREVYRAGWLPDWDDEEKLKFCIEFNKNKIEKRYYTTSQCFLSFQSLEICDLFLENFTELIEKAKPLIS